MNTQFLSFNLGHEGFAIEIDAIQEIRRAEHVTPLAGSPSYILGIIDLRGRILPIVDLRVKFKIARAEKTAPGVIVVLNGIEGASFGVAVDAVTAVLRVDDANIQAVPDFDGSMDERAFRGVVPQGDGLTLVVDVAQLVRSTGARFNATQHPAAA
jgi:purine-binding chemotaxis protein CheW